MLMEADKDLLIKDLCGRLSYGVKCETNRGPLPIYTMAYDGSVLFKDGIIQFCMDNPKPYLRSLLSMTEREENELSKKYNWKIEGNHISIRYHSEGYWDDETECPTEEYLNLFDWLNAHYFDYRSLIKKGLALEAPEGMY